MSTMAQCEPGLKVKWGKPRDGGLCCLLMACPAV